MLFPAAIKENSEDNFHANATPQAAKAGGSFLHVSGLLFLAFFHSFLLLSLSGCGRSADRVVVYCAHDREFADAILREFAQRSGLEVIPRYDSEANKAVGLYEDLVREADRPRCDVHWNNEILATIRLQNQGVYQPYASPASVPYPALYKADDHTWTAFAARARVLLVNTDKVKKGEHPKSIEDLTDPRWRGQVVMAKPQFGTTATHAACLFQSWGEKKAGHFFQKLRENDLRILPGNKKVAEAVGRGQYSLGLTDTDDAAAELEAGNPVAIVFLDREAAPDSGLGTLFIPNTVGLIKNCPNPEGGRRLIDFLLSEEVERKLARSKSKQIPLNPQVKEALPEGFETPHTVQPMRVDFREAAAGWEKSQRSMLKILSGL
jgi:iron(III) transport system substrate-binding protein